MLAVIVTTVLYGAASAFVPALPAEPYLVGLVAATDQPPVPLGVAVGVGQSAGKVVIFLAVRGTIRSPWLRRRLSRLVTLRAGSTAGDPPATEPSAADPATADPATTEPSDLEPSAADPATTEPATSTVAVVTGPGATTLTAVPGLARTRRTAATTGRALARRVPAPLRRLGSAAGRLTRAASQWLTRALDRPVVASLTVLVSAVIGIPPLVATTVYASMTRMSVVLFGTVCVIGRSIRFVALALVPTLIM